MSVLMKVTHSGAIEKYFPLLILALPRKMADKHRDMLKLNEQKLIG